ncbi:MAG: hypothetical protein JST00_26955 [Deltaproteobacteria bacterium]|nr:hypothetical protein [Deltaproteobacteria bacterium]
MAQDAPTGTGDGTLPPPKVTTTVQAQVPNAGGQAAAKPKEEDDGVSDHEKVVGHIAVGYLGLTNLPIAPGQGVPASVNAPVVGVRYWLAEKIGLDLGLGLGFASGSTETVNNGVTVTTPAPDIFGMAIHGGVPLVFAHAKHFKFLLVPELNFGFATSKVQPPSAPGAPPNPETSHSGILFSVGARIGSEIHFGFIGVPQLALQATIGFAATSQSRKTSTEVNGVTNSASQSSFGLGTTVQSDPWALFANSISALYYFP